MYSKLLNIVLWKTSKTEDDISTFEKIPNNADSKAVCPQESPKGPNVQYIDYISNLYEIATKTPLEQVIVETNKINDYYAKSDYDSYLYARSIQVLNSTEQYAYAKYSPQGYAYSEYSEPSYTYS